MLAPSSNGFGCWSANGLSEAEGVQGGEAGIGVVRGRAIEEKADERPGMAIVEAEAVTKGRRRRVGRVIERQRWTEREEEQPRASSPDGQETRSTSDEPSGRAVRGLG